MTSLTWPQFRSFLRNGDASKPLYRQPLKYDKAFEDGHPRDKIGRFVEHDTFRYSPLPERNEKADKIPGGLADDTEYESLDQDQLRKGIKVEKEHTSDPALAKEIASDHLEEFKDAPPGHGYYDELAKMEDRLKNAKDVKADDQHQPIRYTDADWFSDPAQYAEHLRAELEVARELGDEERVRELEAELAGLNQVSV